MSEISVRPLTPPDGPLYREIRLSALLDSPTAFASSHEEEAPRPPEHFAERLAGKDQSRVWGAFLGQELVGMAGLHSQPRPKLKHKAFVWGVFVRPEARGLGCGRVLFEELIRYARSLERLRHLHLGVAVGNAPATRLYESLGFRTYGVEPVALVVDGVDFDEALMVLDLRS
ncbi:MAG: GNAT family N-acetyltransferase [Planctomycetes bacterium]|nr:GNAT family N-acetyltransferase [Planctomycetota bacterium]